MKNRILSLIALVVLCMALVLPIAAEAASSPAAPQVTAANLKSTGKIKLTWEAVENAASYQVYRSTTASGEFKLMLTTDGTSYTNTSAKVGKTYYYYVVSVAADDTLSEPSNTVSLTCTLPRPTVSIGNVASSGKIKLTWEAVEGAAEYEIYRSTGRDGTYKLMMTTDGTSYTNTSAKAGNTYYYKVKAVSETEGADSAYSTIKYRTCDLPRPKLTRVATSTSSISLSWEEVSGASHYTVYRSSAKDGTYKKLSTSGTAFFTDTSVSAGKTYYYKAIANCSESGGNSAASSILTAKAVPSAVTMKTTASATKSSIKVSWNASEEATGYYVYRRASESDSWTRIGTVTSGTSYTDESASGRQYYRIAPYTTVNGTKHTGYKSSAIRCRTLAATGLTAISHVFDNDATWSSVSGATSYQIYRKSDSSTSWTRLATLSDATAYHDDDVSETDHYYYRVRAIYKYDGVTTYGPYTSSEAHYLGSCNDGYDTRSYAIFGEYVDDPRLYYSSAEEAAADMVSITIKVWEFKDSSQTTKITKNYTLKVHKNLAYTVQTMFDELYACGAKYPVSDIGGYVFKNKSEHSSGLAFDINVDANPYVGPDGVIVGVEFDPENNPYSIPIDGEVEQIFYKYGFIRGIYWGNGYMDYMHFSFFGT